MVLVHTVCACVKNFLIRHAILQGDVAELAKKIATLKWHEKEMEVCTYIHGYALG